MTLVVPFDEIFRDETGLLAKHHSWERVPLQLVADVQNGYAFSSSKFSKELGIPLIRIRDLERSRSDTKFNGDYDPAFLVSNGDILVGMDGNFNCVKWDGGKALLNQRVCRILPKTDFIDPTFLRLVLLGYLKAIQASTSSTTVGHLSSNDIKRIPLPLPPLAEQKRIVSKLDELLPKVEACKQRLEKIPTILKRFRQSVLAAAVSGKLTRQWRFSRGIEEQSVDELPSGWRLVPLRDVAVKFNYGSSSKSEKTGKVPVLRMGNIQNGEIDWSDLAYSNDEEEIEKYSLTKNTVLFNRTNSPELVGKTAIYRGDRPAIFAGYLIRIVTGSDLNPEYLNLCLNAPVAREWCREVKSDGVSQSNINAQKLADFEINLPPLEEQEVIVKQVREQLLGLDKIVSGASKAFVYASKTCDAILSRAFSGELVAQDPSEEPASLLLARIKSSAPKPKQKKAPSGKRKAAKAPQSLLA